MKLWIPFLSVTCANASSICSSCDETGFTTEPTCRYGGATLKNSQIYASTWEDCLEHCSNNKACFAVQYNKDPISRNCYPMNVAGYGDCNAWPTYIAARRCKFVEECNGERPGYGLSFTVCKADDNLATVAQVLANLDEAKKAASLTWGIYGLADGKFAGSGYAYEAQVARDFGHYLCVARDTEPEDEPDNEPEPEYEPEPEHVPTNLVVTDVECDASCGSSSQYLASGFCPSICGEGGYCCRNDESSHCSKKMLRHHSKKFPSTDRHYCLEKPECLDMDKTELKLSNLLWRQHLFMKQWLRKSKKFRKRIEKSMRDKYAVMAINFNEYKKDELCEDDSRKLTDDNQRFADFFSKLDNDTYEPAHDESNDVRYDQVDPCRATNQLLKGMKDWSVEYNSEKFRARNDPKLERISGKVLEKIKKTNKNVDC